MTALLRTEFVKAMRRMRTLVIAAALIGLPALIVVAIHAHQNRPARADGEGLIRLAHASGLLVPAAVLDVMSGFLLIVIAAMFAGDCVAGDAAWGNLRYVLMRPVTRGRLLLAKMTVAGTMIWACTVLVALAGLVAGVALFGVHSITVPIVHGRIAVVNGQIVSGSVHFAVLGKRVLLERVAITTVYIAFGYSALLTIGAFFSTLTDSPAGAIGATVGVYIVSEILDGITQLGVVRYGFPTHYLGAWEPMFTNNAYPHDMLVGVFVQLAYIVVFGAAAYVWFARKDIRS